MTRDNFDFIKSYNTPAYRMHFLECICHYILKNQLLTKEEIRKTYYESMAAYYSVNHINSNRYEERMEQKLVERIEAAFIDAMQRRELSNFEKDDIRREQVIQRLEFERAEEDSKKCMELNIKKFIDSLNNGEENEL